MPTYGAPQHLNTSGGATHEHRSLWPKICRVNAEKGAALPWLAHLSSISSRIVYPSYSWRPLGISSPATSKHSPSHRAPSVSSCVAPNGEEPVTGASLPT